MNDLPYYVIGGLMALLALSQVFWMYNVQKLVNKSMSSSYTEYVRAHKAAKTAPAPQADPEFKIKDDYAQNQAEEANRRFGLV